MVPKRKHCWYAQNSYRDFFFFVAEDHSRCHNSNIKKLIKSYTPSHYRREVSGLWANSENHDGFRNLFTALIESSWRHVTGRVTKRNHSLEIRSVLENNELLTTTLFLIFGIVYHPLKIAPAIRWNMLLHKCFGRYRLYVMAIHECLARLSQFVRHWVTYFVLRHATNIIKSKLSTWKK